MADSPKKKLKVKSFYGSRSLDKSTRSNKWGIWPNPISSKDHFNKTQKKGLKRKNSQSSMPAKAKRKSITYQSYSKHKKTIQKQKLNASTNITSPESLTSESPSSIAATTDTESDGLYPPLIKKKIRSSVESTSDTLRDIAGSLEVSLSTSNDTQYTTPTPDKTNKVELCPADKSDSSDCLRTPERKSKVLSFPYSPSLKYVSTSSTLTISTVSNFQNPFSVSVYSQTSFSTIHSSDCETVVSTPNIPSKRSVQSSPCSPQKTISKSVPQKHHKKSSVESIWDDFESAFDKEPDSNIENDKPHRTPSVSPSQPNILKPDCQNEKDVAVVNFIDKDEKQAILNSPEDNVDSNCKQKTLFDYFKRTLVTPPEFTEKKGFVKKESDELTLLDPPKPTRLKLSYQSKLDGVVNSPSSSKSPLPLFELPVSPRQQTGLGKKVLNASAHVKRKPREQLILDAGQKDFGHTTCATCGMVYTRKQEEDEAQHAKYHQQAMQKLKFNGWKSERVVEEFYDGRIIDIRSSDPSNQLKKLQEVKDVVDAELGFSNEQDMYPKAEQKGYLFISNKRVVGCAIALPITKAYSVIVSDDLSPGDRKSGASPYSWCCSTEPVPAMCGISRIWVFAHSRKKKIATRLVDCIRRTFIFGCVIDKSKIAFSDPTPNGRAFAENYTGTPSFLVFR